MARDPKKYLYLTIGVKRGSATYQALLEDAEELGIKQLPTLAGIRLREFYEMKQSGSIPSPLPVKEKVPVHIAGDIELIDAANNEWPE